MYRSWAWRKATASDLSGDQCVEVACNGQSVEVRDSKGAGSGLLAFSPASWQSFVGAAPTADRDSARG